MHAELTRRAVGMAELEVSADGSVELIAYALGSCLGVTAYDPVAGVGGLLHAMLPDGRLDAAKAAQKPAMFIDTGVPLLFRECYRLGARKERMIVRVAGGAQRAGEHEDSFRIGHRNLIALRRLLWRNGVLIRGEDVGGSESRTVSLQVGSGIVQVRTAAGTITL